MTGRDDELSRFIDGLAPADVVPHEPNFERLIELIRSEGQTVKVQGNPEFIFDADGYPMAMTEPIMTEAMLTGVNLTSGEWEALARHLIEKDTK